MEVRAVAKRPFDSRKVRLVLDLIRGKDIEEALAILKFTQRAASPVIAKLVKSAVANATNNHNLVEDKLYIKACYLLMKLEL